VAAPIVISVVSLILSAIGLLISLQPPKAHLQLPQAVRVAQGELATSSTGTSELWLQPSFVSTNRNSQAEVIEDLKLLVKPRQGKSVEFTWLDQGEWLAPDPTQIQGNVSLYDQYYKITSDPTPLVVSPGTAVAPVLRFTAPSTNFQFKEGSYDIILTAYRAILSEEPLEDKMTVTFAEKHLQFYKATAGTQWYYIWNAAAVQNSKKYWVEKNRASEPTTIASEPTTTSSAASDVVGQEDQNASSSAAQTNPSGESSGEEASVAAAVRGHYEAIGEGNFEEAYSYFGSTYRTQIGNNKQGWIDARKGSQIMGSTIKEVNVQTVSENQATATIDVAFQDKGKDSCFFLEWSLVKESGQWKLDQQLSGEPTCI
jgi:hypothetical protein